MDYLLNQSLLSTLELFSKVLNLIINGLPSKPVSESLSDLSSVCFKPYYKWITF